MNLPGFVEQKVLGKGTYGCVYKAQRLSDGQSYAVKVVNLGKLNHREVEDSVNEIRLMASFQSPYIVQFYEAFCDNRRLCIVSEYARLGDMAHLIERRKRKNRPLHEDDIWRYFIQLCEGLRSLHKAGVVHRDLKSANILISAPDLVKIGDLGVSTVLHTTQLARTQIGTPLYLAPEVWKRRPYDSKCDIWSLGILLYEMMTFTYPFVAKTTQELAQRMCLGKYSAPRGYSSDLVAIVRRLLQVNPVLRPSIDEILSLQSVKSRMHLISSIAATTEMEDAKLLSTIKVPMNIKNMHLPKAAYDSHAPIVRPIEQRMHMKKGVSISKDIGIISSPELQLVTDLDWWSPVRGENDPPPNYEQARPLSQRPVLKPVGPRPPLVARAAAPRRKVGYNEANPRFRNRNYR